MDFNLLYYGPSAGAKASPKAPPEVGVPSSAEAAIRLDELVRLQAAIEEYVKERKQELAAAGVPPVL